MGAAVVSPAPVELGGIELSPAAADVGAAEVCSAVAAEVGAAEVASESPATAEEAQYGGMVVTVTVTLSRLQQSSSP